MHGPIKVASDTMWQGYSLLSLDKCNKYLLHLQTVSSAFSVTVKVLGIFMRGGAVVELETNLREV